MPVTRVALVGLGATGMAMGASLLRRMDCELVGAADRRESLVGRDLGEVLGAEPLASAVVADVAALPDADVAIVATTSVLEQVAETVIPLLQRSINVVSICEELAYPWLSHPDLAARLDGIAKSHQVSLLGTGANPGLIMDTLPLLLSALTQRVDRVVIRRRTDMSRYGRILSKFGLGMTPDQFTKALNEGTVVGHIGFEQAIAALGDGLGWHLDKIVVEAVRPTFVSETDRAGEHVTVRPGTIAAVTHPARGLADGRTLIDLELVFGFFRPGDPISPGDYCRVEGAEQTIDISSDLGFESFLSTVSVAVNVVAAVVDAPPGLRSMGDLPVRAVASKGANHMSVNGERTSK